MFKLNEPAPSSRATSRSIGSPRLSQQERLLVGAAHELRTPLTIIRGQLELLRRQVDASETVDTTLDEIARLEEIVERMLLLAELGTGRLVRAPVDLESLLLTLAGSYSVAVTAKVAPGNLIADEAALRLALGELLANALRNSTAAKEVSCVAERLGRGVVIGVSDSGSSVDPAQAQTHFECFGRPEPDRGRMRGGAGLGLAIARVVAQAHGGWVDVRPRRPCGSTWSLWLPRFESREAI